MKILIYSPKFYPSIGGLENLTLMLAKAFVSQGHFVRIICFENSNGIACGVDTYYRPSIWQQIKLYSWSNVFYMPNLSLKGLWLRLFNPFTTWVISHNGWYGPNNSNATKSLNERVKLFLLRFAKNISVSKAVAAYLPVKSIVIANCYDTAVFHTNYQVERTPDVLFVGRLVSDKGIDVLINACLLLWQKGLNFKLTVVGKGEMEPWIKEMMHKHSLEDKLILKGVLVEAALATEMNRHYIMAVPSTWNEPFGIVALEGLACGCSIICSSGGGLPEAAGPQGIFFENGNTAELASLLEQALSSKMVTQESAVTHFLQQHTIEAVAKQYLQTFSGNISI